MEYCYSTRLEQRSRRDDSKLCRNVARTLVTLSTHILIASLKSERECTARSKSKLAVQKTLGDGNSKEMKTRDRIAQITESRTRKAKGGEKRHSPQ